MIVQRTNNIGIVLLRIVAFAIVGRLVLVSSSNLMSSSSGITSASITRGGRLVETQEDYNYTIHNPNETSVHPSPDNETTAITKSERRKRFLERIATASSILLKREHEATLDKESRSLEEFIEDPNAITPQSDLTRPGRYVHIVTTASLPWMTGTAVNPLLRAAYLHERLQEINKNTTMPGKSSWVSLVIPWLELPEDQASLFNGQIFESKQDQEAYVREWLANQARMPNAARDLNIVFYNARYHSELGSVFAMGDIIEQLPGDELDVCILEEPEHVNWFRAPGEGWTKRYNYVLGIIHTNYDQYATQHYSGLWTAPAIRIMSAAMVRAYCHKVIKLSDVLQPFAPEKETTINVHGVREEFIQTNEREFLSNETSPEVEIYFIGKLLWAKGLNLMLEYQEHYKQMTGEYFPVDIYGSGPDQEEIRRAYLGRRPSYRSEEVDTQRKNLFVKAFTWINRRRKKQKKVQPEEIYKDILDVLEAFPTIATRSVKDIPSKLRDRFDQLNEDLSLSKEAMNWASKKLRKAINKLAEDFSKSGLKLDSSVFPQTLYELRRQPIPARFPGRIDHAALKGSYKIFVNPSVSEVLATTTYEALAMGKFAIIPVHPSNTFFQRFPNCLSYRNPYEFVANLKWAITHDPTPLTEDIAREFTWKEATNRLLSGAAISYQEARIREDLGTSKMDERIAWFHNELGKGAKGDVIRKVFGGGPVSYQFRYTKNQRSMDEDEDDTIEDVEGGLSQKFKDSVFVRAIRQATAISMPSRSE